MFIQTETTPNPNALKFFPNGVTLEAGSSYSQSDEAKSPVLARSLLKVEGVENVFFGEDYISINKTAETPWEILKPDILSIISDYFTFSQTIGDEREINELEEEEFFAPEDAEIVEQIKELLDNRVRPAVLQDGGNIIFKGYKEGVVWLKLQGACAGCPSSTITLKEGIENMMQYYIPQIKQVEAIN